MAVTYGLDISHWQGDLTIQQIKLMKSQGIKFVGVKFSQGIGYRDPSAEHNAVLLQSNDILVFPYHFVTVDDANAQFSWFEECVGNFQFDLPPAMDCEHYAVKLGCGANSVGCDDRIVPIRSFRENRITISNRLGLIAGAYLTPTESAVDAIGMKMKKWMQLQTNLGAFTYPTIYTNVYSGNAIFKSEQMRKYNLWVANWYVEKPSLPKVWIGKKFIIWQDGIVDGGRYGISGDVDHNQWGKLFDFPQSEDLPSPSEEIPPENDYFDVVATSNDGKVYKGRVE